MARAELAGGGADGAAAAADGFAGEQELGQEAGELGLPAGLFFAGELGEVGEGVVEGGVEARGAGGGARGGDGCG